MRRGVVSLIAFPFFLACGQDEISSLSDANVDAAVGPHDAEPHMDANGADRDGDGVADAFDNCPQQPNPAQDNADGDEFCVLDLYRYDPSIAVSIQPVYGCSNQGISVGWADIYSAGIPCQWIDITGVADGDYDLRVTTNPVQELFESDYSNNSAEVRVRLAADSVTVME
ncbi:MAG: thrombospondin type 3 repeat-containing protein [Deltaproteobacteria bacterium]|nr:thrombospondin type 3 repeat-containing protein [Deltaproteobacteria bacterium]